jgi:predicted transcriptional regulator
MTGQDLRAARETTLGLSSRAKLGEIIGTSPSNIRDYESGLTPIPGPVERLIFLLLKYKGAQTAILDEYT